MIFRSDSWFRSVPCRFAWCFLLSLCSLRFVPGAFADYHALVLKQTQNGNTLSLEYDMHNLSEATVTVTAEVHNLKPSRALPCTVDVSNTHGVVLSFVVQDPKLPWRITWHYNSKYGHHLQGKPKPYRYGLPFKGTFPILQGPHGTFSHGPGSQDEEAIDWKMPTGTPICAARGGLVIAFRSDCKGGGPDLKWKPDFNFVTIKHEDGTYAEYAHLRYKGVRVRLGERVVEGQILGESGATGFATEPHLHFVVSQTLDGYTRKTLPLTFRAASH